MTEKTYAVPATMMTDITNALAAEGRVGLLSRVNHHMHNQDKTVAPASVVDPLEDQIAEYPAYWRGLPEHWTHIDYYRVRALFPLNTKLPTTQLDHALKKLLVPGMRTGGKSVYKDIKEAHATIGQWLKEHAHAADK